MSYNIDNLLKIGPNLVHTHHWRTGKILISRIWKKDDKI